MLVLKWEVVSQRQDYVRIQTQSCLKSILELLRHRGLTKRVARFQYLAESDSLLVFLKHSIDVLPSLLRQLCERHKWHNEFLLYLVLFFVVIVLVDEGSDGAIIGSKIKAALITPFPIVTIKKEALCVLFSLFISWVWSVSQFCSVNDIWEDSKRPWIDLCCPGW